MAEYLSEDEEVARLRTLWQRYGVPLLVGGLLAFGGVAGWRWYQGQIAERIAAASDLYLQYLEGDAGARQELAPQILEAGKGTAYPVFVLLHQAGETLDSDDLTGAEALLRQAVDVARGDDLADLARLRLARLLHQQERSDEALAVLQATRGHGFLALAAELQGDIHLSRGERRAAHESYTTAMGYAGAGNARPLLEIKIADTVDAADDA